MMRNKTGIRSARSAFTLIELMLVMVIIAILATIVGLKVVNQVGAAKVTKSKADLSVLKNALNEFNIQNGRFPTSEEGLGALINRPSADLPKWEKDLDTNEPPLDGWDHQYIYRCPASDPNNDYDLSSAGPDGQPGTSDDIKAN